MAQITLVLGGARSGKSAFAERLAQAEGAPCRYVATAEARDAEMAERIARHRQGRGTLWQTHEAPLDLAPALARPGAAAVLIDCLTLWLSNLMEAGRDIPAETEALLQAARTSPAPVLLVSNELGLGLVPETPLGRSFRDAQGRLNQRVAAAADRAVFVAAGLPLWLKGEA